MDIKESPQVHISTDMALAQANTIGEEAAQFKLEDNVAIEYCTETFINNVIHYERDCDAKCPEYIIIRLRDGIHTHFNQVCHPICFQVLFDQHIIVSIPLRFMMHLHPYEWEDGEFHITIPFHMFCEDIRLLCLRYNRVSVTLTHVGEEVSVCKLISKMVYYTATKRKHNVYDITKYAINVKPHECVIQTLSSTEVAYSIPQHTFTIASKSSHGIHKGFFIECDNVDDICQLTFRTNNQDRICYNPFLLRKKTVKINGRLLYVPFHYGKSYEERTIDSFKGSANLSVLSIVHFIITVDKPCTRMCVYKLGSNILRIISFMAGLGYEYDNSDIHLHTRIINNNNDCFVNVVYAPITQENKLLCSITMDNICANARYMTCRKCHNNFDEPSIKQWLAITQNMELCCPLCKSPWVDHTVYINGDETVNDLICS